MRRIDERDVAGLWPVERRTVAGAADTRVVEFASGRALLRSLLDGAIAIPVGQRREPVFPAGVTGTLAHDGQLAVAAVSVEPRCAALGVDVEPAAALDTDIASIIRTEHERHIDPALVFVTKEAVYKAWSSLGGGFLEPRDVVVDVDPTRARFLATIVPTAASVAGRHACAEGRYIALVALDRLDVPAVR